MSRSRTIASMLAVTLAAVGLWVLVDAGDGNGTAPQRPTTAPPGATPTAPSPAVTPIAATAERVDPAGDRRSQAPPAPPNAQGLRGRVVDEFQRPLAGCPVYLVDSVGNDPLALPVLRDQRGAFGPVARAETDGDGGFAVGLPVAQDKVYELYVQAPGFATTRRGGLRLSAGHWHDLGTVAMARGATLRGRVTVAGRPDIPVPGATIVVEIGGTFADAALRALPDAGPGLVATANGHGEYELPGVPSLGIVQASAVGRGFARQLRQNLELAADRPTEVDFALLPGHALAGHVVDEAGAPVEGACVEAWPQQAAQSPLTDHSDANGSFEVQGLGPGEHRLRVRASGWHPVEQAGIAASTTGLRLVLRRQFGVRVRVAAQNGAVLRSYQLAIRRWFPETPGQLAAAVEVPEQRVRLDGTIDHAVVPALPKGWFCAQIDADGFARTFSEPFDNTAPIDAANDRQIVVVMTTGGSLRGRVVDEQGLPIAGATVHTDPDGLLPDSPFVRLLGGALPDRATAARATTGTDGAFHLVRLSFANYQLRVEHPSACREVVRGITIAGAEERVLPPVRLLPGAEVRGRVTGNTGGQVKVVLTTLPDLADPARALRLEAIADPDGGYRLPRRVPPGDYELRGAVIGAAEPEAQIFAQLTQLRRSAVPIAVAPGQRLVERDLHLNDH